jgi:hypothetical protein
VALQHAQFVQAVAILALDLIAQFSAFPQAKFGANQGISLQKICQVFEIQINRRGKQNDYISLTFVLSYACDCCRKCIMEETLLPELKHELLHTLDRITIQNSIKQILQSVVAYGAQLFQKKSEADGHDVDEKQRLSFHHEFKKQHQGIMARQSQVDVENSRDFLTRGHLALAKKSFKKRAYSGIRPAYSYAVG